jgi:hypothetical protein
MCHVYQSFDIDWREVCTLNRPISRPSRNDSIIKSLKDLRCGKPHPKKLVRTMIAEGHTLSTSSSAFALVLPYILIGWTGLDSSIIEFSPENR